MPGVLRTVLKSSVALVILYAVWQVGPVYVSYQKLRTEVAEAARVGEQGTEYELQTTVAGLAADLGVPIARNGIMVSKGRTHTQVQVTYTEQLRPLPGVRYPWTFSIAAQGLAVKPRTMHDILTDLDR